MPSVARATYIPLKALALKVIAIYSRSRRKRCKPDRMTSVEPLVERLYSQDELAELRRKMLRYARSFPPGNERNQRLQIAVSLRRLFRNEKWMDAHTINAPQSAFNVGKPRGGRRWRLGRPAFFSRNRSA